MNLSHARERALTRTVHTREGFVMRQHIHSKVLYVVSETSRIKYLGLLIERKMNREEHINFV